MAIYDQFGVVVSVLRLASFKDFKVLEGRRPDDSEILRVAAGSLVVVRGEDGKDSLHLIGTLRAEGGFSEIADATRGLLDTPILFARGTLHELGDRGEQLDREALVVTVVRVRDATIRKNLIAKAEKLETEAKGSEDPTHLLNEAKALRDFAATIPTS